MQYGCLSAIVFCSISAAPLRGQSFIGSTSSVAGEISLEGSERADWLSVELLSSGRTVSRGPVGSDGRFELGGVPSGEYELRLTGSNETIVQRQFVSVHGHLDGVVFRLDRPERARPVTGTVTVYSLLHKVPAGARKELIRAARAARKGGLEESLRHLRRALAIDPDYMEAHNDLGCGYMKQGAYELAVSEFQRAVKLDPGAARPKENLGLAWRALGRGAGPAP